MNDIYGERYETEYTRIRTEDLEDYRRQIEEQKDKISGLEEDLIDYKSRNAKFRKKIKDYEELVKVFLENANNLLITDDETIAKTFEFIKAKGLIENGK